jgi:hypothetical protein
MTKKDETRRWEKSAARENARRAAKAPLLAHAGLVPLITPDEQRAKVERQSAALEQRLAECRARMERAAVSYRAEISAHAAPEALAALDAEWEKKRSWLPEDPVYRADHWHTEKRRRGLCRPHPRLGAPFCDCGETP